PPASHCFRSNVRKGLADRPVPPHRPTQLSAQATDALHKNTPRPLCPPQAPRPGVRGRAHAQPATSARMCSKISDVSVYDTSAFDDSRSTKPRRDDVDPAATGSRKP